MCVCVCVCVCVCECRWGVYRIEKKRDNLMYFIRT